MFNKEYYVLYEDMEKGRQTYGPFYNKKKAMKIYNFRLQEASKVYVEYHTAVNLLKVIK